MGMTQTPLVLVVFYTSEWCEYESKQYPMYAELDGLKDDLLCSCMFRAHLHKELHVRSQINVNK